MMDLTGPMLVIIQNRYVYTLVVVEVSYYYSMEKLLKLKKEISKAIRNIIVIMERQSDGKVQHFCSDNGLEFVNSIIDLFCQQNGMLYEMINSYLPKQNEIAKID